MREIANQIPDITGGADGLPRRRRGAHSRHVHLDIWPRVLRLMPDVSVRAFYAGAARVYSPLAVVAGGEGQLRCAKNRIGISVNARLVAITLCSVLRRGAARAAGADHRRCLARRISFESSADLLPRVISGGTGYLYGGADRGRDLQS